MRKIFLILLMAIIAPSISFAARANSLPDRTLESFVDTGTEASIEITLSGTPGTDTKIVLPTTAKGIKLFPRGSHVRFAVTSDSTRSLASVATSSSATIQASSLAVGGIAKNDMWETRQLPAYLPNSSTRVLTIRSTTASVVIDLETF